MVLCNYYEIMQLFCYCVIIHLITLLLCFVNVLLFILLLLNYYAMTYNYCIALTYCVITE